MIRGTTAQFKFKMPYTKDELMWLTIKFWQPNNQSDLLPITKIKDDCVTTDNPKEILVSLTAEETSRFLDKYKAKMQLRAQNTLTGTVFGTKPRLVTVYPMLDNLIEEDPMIPIDTGDRWIIIDGGNIIEE